MGRQEGVGIHIGGKWLAERDDIRREDAHHRDAANEIEAGDPIRRSTQWRGAEWRGASLRLIGRGSDRLFGIGHSVPRGPHPVLAIPGREERGRSAISG